MSNRFKYCLAIVAFVFPLLHLTTIAQGQQIRIGVLALRGPSETLLRWDPTADYLTDKIEAGQMTISNTKTSLNKLLDELYSFFNPDAISKGLTLISFPTLLIDEATIFTDNEKLHVILSNLITNAIKYTKKGKVAFSYLLKNSFLEFFVKDTGIGVPEERQQAIFNRFEQADIKDTRVFEGAGLGLAIAKAYVEMLGGRIWLSSEVGKGSKFMFTIPFRT
ncbi:MAG: ATP-binding protein [Bacteroidota bacterium]|nr:ATP-binding protein [Bacteroidota bacterium]